MTIQNPGNGWDNQPTQFREQAGKSLVDKLPNNCLTTNPASCKLEGQRKTREDCSLKMPLDLHWSASEFSLEVPLDIEEYVSFAGVDSLEVGLFHTAVIEVEPGFIAGGKGSVVA